jgi:predicted PurR-regulated permease PerM
MNLIPEKYRLDAQNFFHDVDKAIGGYIRGQLIVVIITGTMTGFTMLLLGVPFAALIGIFVAITDIVPYIGPIVGSIPAVLISLLESPRLAVFTLASIILIQQVEANVIAPRIVSHQVGLHPIVIIFSLFVGRELFGVPGMLIAVPTAATIRVFARHIYKHFF